MGYHWHVIATDHEQHWLGMPLEKRYNRNSLDPRPNRPAAGFLARVAWASGLRFAPSRYPSTASPQKGLKNRWSVVHMRVRKCAEAH